MFLHIINCHCSSNSFKMASELRYQSSDRDFFLFLDNCTSKKIMNIFSAIIFDDVLGRNNNNNNNRTSRCWQLSSFYFPRNFQSFTVCPFTLTSTAESGTKLVMSICARQYSWNAFWQLSSWWSAWNKLHWEQPGKSCQTKEPAKDRS